VREYVKHLTTEFDYQCGTRQQNRAVHADINVDYDEKNISEALKLLICTVQPTDADFGQGNSAELF
jgi:hypothetical protein